MSRSEPAPPAARTERRPATDEEARVLASSLRLRILRACLGEPRTNREIARALERDPATVLHHVRRLVDAGFLQAHPARRGTRGAREIPYSATLKSWQVSTPAKSQPMVEAFLEEVALVPAETLETSRLGLRLSAEHLEEFRDRVTALLDEYALRPGDPGGEAVSVFFAVHPDPNRR